MSLAKLLDDMKQRIAVMQNSLELQMEIGVELKTVFNEKKLQANHLDQTILCNKRCAQAVAESFFSSLNLLFWIVAGDRIGNGFLRE